VSPFVALVSGNLQLAVIGSLALSALLVFSLTALRDPYSSVVSLLLFPVGLLLYSLVMIRAAYKCTVNRGIDWRGTHYATHELKAGQRVKL